MTNPYNIHICQSFTDIASMIKKFTENKQIIIVYDSSLAKTHLPELLSSLKHQNIIPNLIKLKANEKNKNFIRIQKLCHKFLSLGITKETNIIAFGGGITGDIVGFCASILLRGLKLYHIPTTLLAMSDSAIGGKNGVNTKIGKNYIGTIYQPHGIFINVNTLKTLHKRHYLSGYAECLKYALLFSRDYFNYLDANYQKFLDKDPACLQYIIEKSCAYKTEIINEDEFETKNIRYLLNLGHTFAHAFEKYNGYKTSLTHGESVSIGILLDFKLSCSLGLCHKEDYEIIKQHLNKIGLPHDVKHFIKNISIKKLMTFIAKDKKNTASNLVMVSTNSIGDCFVNNTIASNTLVKFLTKELT